jgi:hypothetical protein
MVRGGTFRVRRTLDGVELLFPVLRAPGVALTTGVFGLVSAFLPALSLAALLPLQSADGMAMVSLALLGGMAAPFLLASVVFTVLAIYMLSNSLTVTVTPAGVHAIRRVFGRAVQLREIAQDDVAQLESQISARYQNVFGAIPRYRLVAQHRDGRSNDVVIAEDLIGAEIRDEVQKLVESILDEKITSL